MFVVANLVCQPGWAMGSPDSWPNVVQNVFLRAFLGEIHIELVGRGHQTAFPPWGSPTESLKACREQRLSRS